MESTQCCVQHWDGSTENVEVLELDVDDVRIRYADGEVHSVPQRVFDALRCAGTLEEQLDAIVERCAKYSGWDLQWRVDLSANGTPNLRIWDPKDGWRSSLLLEKHLLLEDSVHAYYGRTWHWNISHEEMRTMRTLLDNHEAQP